jgi:hypothetical protein
MNYKSLIRARAILFNIIFMLYIIRFTKTCEKNFD